MKLIPNQRTFIIDTLVANNEISRNYCLRRFITRLAAVIGKLKKEGWIFAPEDRDGDYVYIALYIPEKYKKDVSKIVLPKFASEYVGEQLVLLS